MDVKNLHFQRHKPLLNTYEKRDMFPEMQNSALRSSDIISPNSFSMFCSLFEEILWNDFGLYQYTIATFCVLSKNT